jgi:hypothetical protein
LAGLPDVAIVMVAPVQFGFFVLILEPSQGGGILVSDKV